MKNRLFWKIFLRFAVLIVLLVITIFILSFEKIQNESHQTHIQYLKGINQLIIRQIQDANLQPPLNPTIYAHIKSTLDLIAQTQKVRISLIAPTGEVLYDTATDEQSLASHRTRPEIKQALNKEIAWAIRYSATLKASALYVTTPLLQQDQVVAVIRSSALLTQVDRLFHELQQRMLLITLILLAIAVILLAFLVRDLTRPLQNLVLALKAMRTGPIEVGPALFSQENELLEIGRSLYDINSQLEQTNCYLQTQQTKFQQLIDALEEAIILIDPQDRIQLANQKFCHIAGLANPQEVIEKYYWQIIRSLDLNQAIEQNRNCSIQIDNRHYQMMMHPTLGDARAMILYDQSLAYQLSTFKRDLVTNVSHEIKTPLSVIKGYLETLETSPQLGPSDRQQLATISHHTERLIAIVCDLLTLSELEQRATGGAPQLECQSLHLRPIIESAAALFANNLQTKGLQLELNLPSDLPKISGDPFRLEQVFINLIDNAVKYSRPGQIHIEAQTNASKTKIELRLTDQGPGIAPSDCERIFERFYIAGRDRRRGTGLGLAIVKHILQLHGATITASSQLGQSTTFTLTFRCQEAHL